MELLLDAELVSVPCVLYTISGGYGSGVECLEVLTVLVAEVVLMIRLHHVFDWL